MNRVASGWNPDARAIVHHGDCRDLLADLPEESTQLFVTSPPYNIGKAYEKRTDLDKYLAREREVIGLCVDKLRPGGSICWQVGNHVANGEVYPLDVLLYPMFKEAGLELRNRIIWHFEHGLHGSRRFSGRYETILWFTKADSSGRYVFNLDPVRVPQKYPGKKHFKGVKKGQPSANPLGKNPGDFWQTPSLLQRIETGDVWIIPNVKHNHIEKTLHPCQFPIELVERLVLALSNPDDLVVDPYMGVGSALAAAVRHGRRGAGAEIVEQYVNIALDRLDQALDGILPSRPLGRSVYVPPPESTLTQRPWADSSSSGD